MRKSFARIAVMILTAPASALAIVGGQEIRLDHSPRIASVLAVLNQESGEICSGTLIENQIVVTAAHCLGQSASAIFIYAGEKVDSPRSVYIADAAVRHANYNGQRERNENDLALVHFNGALPKVLRPIKLVDGEFQFPADAKLTIAGYGINSMKNGGQGDGVLRQTAVALAQADFTTKEFLLDQSQGRGSCEGDSGGPALIEVDGELRLAGVLSRPAEANHTCRKPTVYTKVAAFREWIQNNSQALVVKAKPVFRARLLKN